MTSCKEVYAFLSQVASKNVTTPLPDPDSALLTQLNLVQFLSPEEYHDLQSRVEALGVDQAALAQESAQRAGVAKEVDEAVHDTHSFTFHLEGREKQAEALQKESAAEAELRSMDSDLAQKQQALGQLVAQRSLLDTVTPCGGRFAALTSVGTAETRDLGLRLYRVGDADFSTYWGQTAQVMQDLGRLAAGGADYFARLAPVVAGVVPSNLWATSIGLAKDQPDSAQGSAAFASVFAQVRGLSGNLENALMSSEILFSLDRPLSEELAGLLEVLKSVESLRVPRESALGVASILLLGRRADGTIATDTLPQYLGLTRSFEAAALLAIVNVPVPDLNAKFQSLRSMFAGWGYQDSEDVELSSAYLATSEVPLDGIGTKLAIIARGLQTYLAYPLVTASVLSTISTYEANDTLNLLEHAYDIVGRRASGLSQAELICLGVRMLHGIRDELVGPLDTAAPVPAAAPLRGGIYGPRFFFVPIVVVSYGNFATYSGIGGTHPGHVHGIGGGGGSGGGGFGGAG